MDTTDDDYLSWPHQVEDVLKAYVNELSLAGDPEEFVYILKTIAIIAGQAAEEIDCAVH